MKPNHVTLEIDGIPPITDSEAVNDSRFDENRAAIVEAQARFNDSSLTQAERDAAQSEVVRRSMANIRLFDPYHKEPATDDDHLLEAGHEQLLLEESEK